MLRCTLKNMKNKNEREKFQWTETTEYTVYIFVFKITKSPQKLYRPKIELFQPTNATDHATEYMYNIYFSLISKLPDCINQKSKCSNQRMQQIMLSFSHAHHP